MACGCDKQKPIETQYLGDVQIDALEDLPNFLLGDRSVKDELSGDTIHSLVRIPTDRIVPNGNLDNIFAVVANNDTLEIPEGQVRAGTVKNLGSSYSVVFDDSEEEALFVMVGRDAKRVFAQRVGVVNLLNGHEYVLLAQYYASADGSGEPTTDSASGKKLFIPISKTQLLLNMD